MNRFYPLFLLLFGFAQIVYSQTDSKLLQTQWTTENGLPQNSVNSIEQTSDGYLWIATFGGLARFDGVRFKIFTTANTPPLKSNRLMVLLNDRQGTLWIGTQYGEVIVQKNGEFHLIADANQFENKLISDIYEDESGTIWISSEAGLQKCTLNGCQKTEWLEPIGKIKKDSEGNFWLVSLSRLFKVSGENFLAGQLILDEVITFEIDEKGLVWVIRLNEFGLLQNSEYQTKMKSQKEFFYADIVLSANKEIWITAGKIVYQVSENTIKKYEIDNVAESNSKKIFFDKDGGLWLGRSGDGLIQLLNPRLKTLTFEQGENNPIAVNSLVEDNAGNVFISSTYNVYSWNLQKTETADFSLKNPKTELNGALLIDSSGTLWNNASGGLFYQRQREIIKKDLPTLPSNSGNLLFEDKNKRLWVGRAGYGVYCLENGEIVAHYTVENGLVGNLPSFAKQTRDGAIWIGTTNGLSQFKDAIFTNYTTENGLSNNYVRDIYEDQDGTLWIGTYGGGLNRFKDGKFSAINTNNGLFDDVVSQILVDDYDNFWMLDNRGIFSVNRQTLNDLADGRIKNISCLAYTTADGMITSEGNGGHQNSAIRTRDGKLWFSMINGVVIIDPKQEKTAPPKPIIEEVLIERELINFSGKLELDLNHEDIEIHYTGFNFRKSNQMKFRYRMLGLDDDWEEVGTRRVAYYPRLTFGKYNFQVIAANSNGEWGEEIAGFEIIVHPPFYRTWWFFILIWLLFFGILISSIKYKNLLFAKEKAKQEDFTRRLINTQETERKRIASEIHDSLGQQLLVIKNWASYCLQKSRKLSEMRLPIQQINTSAEEALHEVRAMAKMLSPYHLDKVGVSNTIRFMIKQVAESSEINFETDIDDIDGILSKENDINLYRIVQESTNNIIKHSQASKAKVSIKKSENFIKLSVSDNGIGFYQDKYDYEDFGIGLLGIAERAKMLGGNFVYESIETKGTNLKIDIELNEKHTSN